MPDQVYAWPQGDALLAPLRWGNDAAVNRLRGGDNVVTVTERAMRAWGGEPSPSTGAMWALRGSASDDTWYQPCWSPELGIFVVPGFGSQSLMVSSDGIRWTSVRTPTSSQYTCVCWSKELNLFVALAKATNTPVTYSRDGLTWTRTGVTGEANRTWYSIIWAKELELFVASGAEGAASAGIMTSPNGVNWTLQTHPDTSIGHQAMAWSPELSLFVVTPYNNNKAIVSSDGINWSVVNLPANIIWSGIAWSRELGIFVVQGGGGQIAISADGTNWTLAANNGAGISNIGGNNLCWCPEIGMFVHVGASFAATSRDGYSWSRHPIAANNSWFGVCWSPELRMLVAAGQSGTGNRIMTSGGL